MDVILQVCIGALPLLLGVAVYMIAKRKMLLPSILLGVEIICCVVTGIVFSGSKAVPITELEAVDVYASYLALEEGDSNAATEIIAKAFAKAGDKAEITLAQARVYASQGSWEKAIALYQKVSAIDKSLISGEEARLVSDIVAGDIMTASQLAYYTSNVNYLTSMGLNPVEYGFQVLSQSRVDANIKRLDQFQQTVVSQIVDDELKELEDKYPIVNDIEKIDKAVEMTMSYSYNTYNGVSYEADDGTWTSGGDAATADKTGLQKIKALASRLEKYKEKYPDLFAEKKYMEAYIYAQAIAGEDLDNVWKQGTAAENEVVANMYISGIITEENFSKEFTKEYKKVFKEVLDQCKKVAKKIHKDEDITEVYVDGKSVYDIVAEMKQVENFASHQIENDMATKTEKGQVPSDELTGYYITMSAVASQNGNETIAKEYFNQSVAHSHESSDKELSQVMGVIKESYEEGTDLDYIQMAEQVANTYQDSYYYDIVSDEIVKTVEGVSGGAMSEAKARITICNVDVSGFEKIVATVQYSGDSQLKKNIVKLTDCDIDIKDFKIEKRQYDGSKVMLLCDVSGSMSGSMDKLREAVLTYIRSMEMNEKVNIVLFSDKIDATSGFTSNKETLEAFANTELVDTRGGTAITESASISLDEFTNGNIANTMIIMTDGEDNSPWSESRIKSDIGAKAAQTNTYIYTIGVGSSIAQTYLENIAECGGGEFLYCSDISLLEETYKFIHKRINSEYIVSFEAEDLDSLTRTLKIKVDDGKASESAIDTKTYYLKGEATEEGETQFSTELPKGVVVSGLNITHIDKSTESQLLKIMGSGFGGVGVTDVYLEGVDAKSHCKIKEVKDNSVTFQVAPSVEEGIYSVFVTIDGKKYKVDQLAIGNVNETELVFGAYRFKADSITRSENRVVLTGNVVLNDYLYFDGAVTIDGNIGRDSSVTLSTRYPAYVHHDTASYSALDKFLLPSDTQTYAFGNISVKLYDDGANYNNYAEYKVEMSEASRYSTVDLGFISMSSNTTYIYPNRVEVVSGGGLFESSVISDVISVEFFELDKDDLPSVEFKSEMKAMLMKEGPHTVFEVDTGVSLNDDEMKVDIADMFTLDGSASFTFMFDTYNRQFKFGIGMGTEEIEGAEASKLGEKAEVKHSGDWGLEVSILGLRNEKKLLNVNVALPLELTFYVYGVPVTVTDLSCKLENYDITATLEDMEPGETLKNMFNRYVNSTEGADLTVSGAVELVSTSALPDKAQKFIEKYLGGDVSLVSVDDIYGTVGLNYPHIGAGATVNVLGCVEVAHMEMELGVIKYPGYIAELLNATEGEKHYGFTFTSSQGIKFDWDAVGANIGGKVSAIVTVDDFLAGGYISGTLSGKLDVNIFGIDINVNGEAKTEAYGAVWVEEYTEWFTGKTKTRWKGAVMVVASVDGTTSINVFGKDILEKDYHNRTILVDEDFKAKDN